MDPIWLDFPDFGEFDFKNLKIHLRELSFENFFFFWMWGGGR